MRTSRMMFSTLALLAGASLALTGCSNSAEKAAEDNALSKYFEAFDSGEEWTEERYNDQLKAEQEYIAQCMTALGFEYTPDVQTGGWFTGEESEGPEWGTLEFAEQYGFGIVDWPGSMGYVDEDFEEYVDPNGDYVMSLSESEQNAYYEALYGPQPTEEEWAQMEEDEIFEWNPEDQGCYGEAVEQSGDSSMEMYEDPEFADLWDSLDMMWEDIENDDRIIALNREWMTCMSEEGYSQYTSSQDAQDQLQTEWSNFYDELNANLGEFDEWQEPSQADKDEFMSREIPVAVADFKCNDKIDREKIYIEVNNDISQKFVDAHKAELDAMVAKYGIQK